MPEPEGFDATLIAPYAGGGALRQPPDRIPEKIGKYVIRQELGRGASGVVYKSHDPFVKRAVAVKVARHQGHSIPEDTPEGQAFFAEARAAGLLQHPHIVSLYDAGVEGDLFYLVMEYIEGRTLASLCRPGEKRPTLDLVVDIIFKCAKALDYAHSKGILHRDIKPSNIMINMAGLPKIMDFSISEINVAGASAGGFALTPSLLGSPMYMSPEQARMQRFTPASDLYSLGVVMHQMLTGQPLFRARDLRMLMAMIDRHVPPRIEAWRNDVPEELSNLVARLLSKNPRERPQSGNELAAELALIYDRLRAEGRMLLRRDNSDSLRRLRFFNRFTVGEMEEILNVGTLAHYAANTLITQEGEVDNAFYIVVVGEAEMRKSGNLLHRLEKGDCFGEAGFVSASRSTCSVIANSQVLVLKVSDARLEQCSEVCQLRFYKTFLESMIHRLSAASAKALKVTWPGG